jgi:serine/threonine protein phosphatase 1
LKRLKLSVSFGDYLFVHAGVRPGVPLSAQSEADLVWIRGPFLNHSEPFGKVVVHGHTPEREPVMRPNRIGIDTGAVFTGRLTALRLQGSALDFLQT